MYPARYPFATEEDLESLIVEAWLRFETLGVATPDLTISTSAGGGGVLEIRFRELSVLWAFRVAARPAQRRRIVESRAIDQAMTANSA